MDNQRTLYSDQLTEAKRDLAKSREAEAELNKKLESLKQKSFNDLEKLQSDQENERLQSQEKIEELENQLKATQEAFEGAKLEWEK
jgi:ABC-type uncharacterized transport system ATPase subunit